MMSLYAPYDPGNIFARILRGEMPAVTVWEDDHVLAFMDVFPQSDGHVLIISKTSTAKTLLDIEAEALARLTAAVQRTARAVEKALRPDGFKIMQLNGAAGGQSVFHLHFHVIPRWSNRRLKEHGHPKMADTAVLRGFADRIAAALE
jgi:histidine triad (HIT) family protein